MEKQSSEHPVSQWPVLVATGSTHLVAIMSLKGFLLEVFHRAAVPGLLTGDASAVPSA